MKPIIRRSDLVDLQTKSFKSQLDRAIENVDSLLKVSDTLPVILKAEDLGSNFPVRNKVVDLLKDAGYRVEWIPNGGGYEIH